MSIKPFDFCNNCLVFNTSFSLKLMRGAPLSLFLLGCHPHVLDDIEFASIDDFSSFL